MKNQFNPKSTLLTIIVAMSSLTFAQKGAEISDVDILAEQKGVVIEHYPGVFKSEEINKIEKINDKQSKIYYQRGGANFEAVVNSDRKDLLLVATCEEIPQSTVPDIVRVHFKKSKLGVNKILKSFIVKTPTSSDFYRLDIINKDKQVASVFYDHLGMEMIAPYQLALK